MRLNLLALAAVTLMCVVSVPGHGEEKTGVLVDASCVRQAADGSGDAVNPADCPPTAETRTFGIIADGDFLPFDDYGNRQARLILKTVSPSENLKVRVGGHFEDGIAKVSELETVE